MKLPSKEKCLEWAREAGFDKLHVKDPDTIYILPLIVPEVMALIHRAYKEGAEAMREEAAGFCDVWNTTSGNVLAKHIRNLKVEEV